ncbi:acetyltransferase [Flavobacterium sp. GSP14]|uniref:acetyltransferase n=1 Tax=Flavobacterium sp. GSP14 TaxID=3401734 RepID=UPI003AABC467
MKTFIFGGSGFAKEVEFYIAECNVSSKRVIDVYSFVVIDSEYEDGLTINGVKVISETEYFASFHNLEMHNCIIAVGSPYLKYKIYNKINSKHTQFPTIIHPSVTYDHRFFKIGKGSIICAGVVLTTNIIIGDFVHININSTVGHDCEIGEYSTISPGVQISGNVMLSMNSFIGTGASVLEKISIVSDTIIGAGAVVTKSIEEAGTYVGIPVKKIK